MECASCGAGLGQTDARCQYCGAATPYGAYLEQHQHLRAAELEALRVQQQQVHQQRLQTEAKVSLDRTARHSLYWSFAGLALCCALVPSVVGIVMGFRARKMASKYHLVLPVQATAGLVVGWLGLLLGVSLLVFAALDAQARAERIRAIDRELGERAAGPDLSHAVACLLAEKRLLQGGFRDDKTFDAFECDGRLEQQGSDATLHDIRIDHDNQLISLKACLTRGQRWSVSSFRRSAACHQPDDTRPDDTRPDDTSANARRKGSATSRPAK